MINTVLSLLLCIAGLAQVVAPQALDRSISYISFQEAKPLLEAMRADLPLDLRNLNDTDLNSRWVNWVKQSDAEIRGRLEQGDEDSIVNLLLFGTSFTKQPRMTENQMNQLASEQSQKAAQVYQTILEQRLDDFILALASRQSNERLSFAKSHLVRKLNVRVETEAGEKAVKRYLIESLRRVVSELTGLAGLIEQARKNQEDVFVVRSMLFSRRGLSSDTSLKPNFAIENALAQLKEKDLLKNVRRVAIIGPGLDFTDKEEGYDFYPPQTLQPFAVIESLLKVGLADKSSLQIDTYDLSPKVNAHVANIARKARRKETYTIQLPLEIERKFTPEFLSYWQNFGRQIALPPKPISKDTELGVNLRSVVVRNEFLSKVHGFDTNIVLQSPVLAESGRYDLVIGTNIFVYYNPFEQGLAMRNLNKMLKHGGILLSNNGLIEFPFTPIYSTGYTRAVYSDKPDDADAIIWYQKGK